MDLNNLDEATLQRLVQQLIATGQFKPKEPTEPEAWNIEGIIIIILKINILTILFTQKPLN